MAAYVPSARSDPYGLTADDQWDIRGANAQRMKRLRDENPPETHKKRRTEALEVPTTPLPCQWTPPSRKKKHGPPC